MTPQLHPREFPAVTEDTPIRFSVGVILTVLTATFILGATFTTYAMKFEELSTRVDKLATALDNHINAHAVAAKRGATTIAP